ncbi:MAG: DNA polymerase [Sinobacteraceae bacterium]|nr:DNA polymerase [Nevskiaceae bacterium]
MPLKDSAVARLIGHWEAFYEWLAEHHGFAVKAVPDQPQHCPSHGGKSGAAFRFYTDMAWTGGGVCNSCDNLRASNGIDLLLGWLLDTKRAEDARAAFITLSGWVEAFATGRAEVAPQPSPQIAKRLREWVGSNDGATVALNYFRRRGLTLESKELPPSLRGTLGKGAKSPELRALLLLKGRPVTYYRILLDAQFNKRHPQPAPGSDEQITPNKRTAWIDKEIKLSGAYVPLGSDGSKTLVTGEGIETSMALRRLYPIAFPSAPAPDVRASVGRAWKSLYIPDGVQTVLVCADNDHTVPQTLKAITELREQHPDKRIALVLPPEMPTPKKDWLDACHVFGETEAATKFLQSVEQGLKEAEPPASGSPPSDHPPGSDDPPPEPSSKRPRVVSLPETDDRTIFHHFDTVFDAEGVKPWYWGVQSGMPVKVNSTAEPVTTQMLAAWLAPRITFLNSSGECTSIPTTRVGLWEQQPSTTERMKSGLRPLAGVLTRPAIVRNSVKTELLVQPGYDAITHYHLNISDSDAQACASGVSILDDFRSRALAKRRAGDLPEEQVAKRAERALAAWALVFPLRDHILADFDFSSPADEANAWAAALTPPVAPSVGHTPMILITAPMRGSGKTTLMNLLTSLWERPVSFGWPASDEELEKRIGAAFAAGRSLILMDNVTRKLQSDVLARVVTSPELSMIRRLGTNDTIAAPPGLTLYATANNPDVHEDIKRRVLPIRLDPRGLDPAKRPPTAFRHPDIENYLASELPRIRARLYAALMAWARANAPESPSNVPLTGFHQWQRSVAGLLRFVGRQRFVAALLGNRDAFLEGSDQASEETDRFMQAWADARDPQQWAAPADLVEIANENDLLAWVLEAKLDAAKSKRLGHWIKSLVGRKFELGGQVVVLERSDSKLRTDKSATAGHAYRLAPASTESTTVRAYRREEVAEFDPDELELQRLLDVAGADPDMETWLAQALPWILGRPPQEREPGCDDDAGDSPPPSTIDEADTGVDPPFDTNPVREAQSQIEQALFGEQERSPTSRTPTAVTVDESSPHSYADELIGDPPERNPDDDERRRALIAAGWSADVEEDFAALEDAPWKVIDTETTALTPDSQTPVVRHGDARARLRIVSAIWPGPDGAQARIWDLDTLAPDRRVRLARAALNRVVIAHNGTFDLNWLRGLAGAEARPTAVLDTMVLGRIMVPETPVLLAKLAGPPKASESRKEASVADTDGGLVLTMQDGGRAHEPTAADAAASLLETPWSLAAMVYVHLGRLPDKTLQGPSNWTGIAPLSAHHLAYAAGDARDTLDLLLRIAGSAPGESPTDAVKRWFAERDPQQRQLLRVWSQVPIQLSDMHLTGLPFDAEAAKRYAEECQAAALEASRQMVGLSPEELEPVRDLLIRDATGMTLPLKNAIAAAFIKRGVSVTRTAKSREPAVGEKALRAQRAASKAPELFAAWSRRSRMLRRAEMAAAFAAFVRNDGRIHGLFASRAATARVIANEPNLQQVPGDADFRALVRARKGYVIVSADYAALDVRVGATLALIEQDTVRTALSDAKFCKETYGSVDVRWKLRKLLEPLLRRAAEAGETDGRYSALRAAFRAELDIHSWTAVRLAGSDPAQVVAGLTGAAGVEALDAEIKRRGGSRKLGKVANLGLLYAMGVRAFMLYAASVWDLHLTEGEAKATIDSWLGTYAELELWRKSVSLRARTLDQQGRWRLDRYDLRGLAGRRFVAMGLTDALSYPDQGSGADILFNVSDRLWRDHRDLYDALVLQVHDEIVLELPEGRADEGATRLREVMLSVAHTWTQPYGVPMNVAVEVGETWS